MDINIQDIMSMAKNILAIDSPTGYTQNIITYIKGFLDVQGYTYETTNKGNLIIKVEGQSNQKVIGLSGHVDTLGLMVRSIKSDGTLTFTSLGGPILNTLDGEYCRIITRNNKIYSGTILSTSSAVHVFKDATTLSRNEETMEVKIDEQVHSKEDVLALGIQSGDIISIDPKTEITKSGFIKSRFLDDKISVAILLVILKKLKEDLIKLPNTTYILISCFEEVGHGSSHIPGEISELVSIDMGCVGKDLNGNEYNVSICAKDSSGPYDYQLVSKFIALAQKNKLNYAVDVFPYYGSDTSAALRAGNNIKGGLIGPGVANSHGMERTHIEGVENAAKLIVAYLLDDEEL